MRQAELFKRLQKEVLGPHYDLQHAFLSPKEMRKVTRRTKNKNKVSNVLSFPLSKTEGEIFLNISASAREARRYETTHRKRLALLFVHGLLHLKGLRHGRTMDTRERKILRAFGLA